MIQVKQHGRVWFVVGNCRLVFHPRRYTGMFQKLDGREEVCDFWNDVSEWQRQSSKATKFESQGDAESYIDLNRERIAVAVELRTLHGE